VDAGSGGESGAGEAPVVKSSSPIDSITRRQPDASAHASASPSDAAPGPPLKRTRRSGERSSCH
jgi:hypothetical protein